MFENLLESSTNRAKTKTGMTMVVALIIHGVALLALVLVPLLFPEALPAQVGELLTFLAAPPPPPPPPPLR